MKLNEWEPCKPPIIRKYRKLPQTKLGASKKALNDFLRSEDRAWVIKHASKWEAIQEVTRMTHIISVLEQPIRVARRDLKVYIVKGEL